MDNTATIIFSFGKMWSLFETGVYEINMEGQVDKAFSLDSIVCGHWIYKTVWTPFWGEILTATPEHKSDLDRHAVRVKKDGDIIGHILCKLSQTVWLVSPG